MALTPFNAPRGRCEMLGCFTLPETSIAPENRPLEKEIPIGNHYFQVLTVSFRAGSRCFFEKVLVS